DGAATEVVVRDARVDVTDPHRVPCVRDGALDDDGGLHRLRRAVRVGDGEGGGVVVDAVVGVLRVGLGGRRAVPDVPVPRHAAGAGAGELDRQRAALDARRPCGGRRGRRATGVGDTDELLVL